MKTKLFLFCSIFAILSACSIQPTSVEPESIISLKNNIPLEQTIMGDVSNDPKEKKKKPENGRPTIFGDLISKLNLSEEQKAKTERLLVAHKACTEECIKIVKSAEREVLKNAKIKEEVIKAKLNAGEITKDVAMRELRELKQKTNQELKSISNKMDVKECVKNCDSTFITELKSLLTPDQLVVLSQWQEQKTKRN